MKKNLVSVALRHLESSVKKTPDDPVALYHLGVAYIQSGDFIRAKGALNRALTLKPDFDGAPDARKALSTSGV